MADSVPSASLAFWHGLRCLLYSRHLATDDAVGANERARVHIKEERHQRCATHLDNDGLCAIQRPKDAIMNA